MQSSYQYHYGGQAAAARGANESPNKNASAKAQGAQPAASTSSMFTAKVDWGSSNGNSGAAAAEPQRAPYGFGGGSVGFGGVGATNASPVKSKPSFGGPATGAAAAFGGSGPSFGGAPATNANSSFGRGSAAASSFGNQATGSAASMAA